jgi:hypothetical protein
MGRHQTPTFLVFRAIRDRLVTISVSGMPEVIF